MRQKILIFVPNIAVANTFFVQSRMFDEIARLYDIYICSNTAIKGTDLDLFSNRGFKGVYGYKCSAKRKKIYGLQLHVNTLGGRKFSKSCSVIYDMNKKDYGNIVQRFVHRVLGGTYYTARLTSYMLEKYAGQDKNIEDIIHTLRPDLIITFLCGSALLEVESIKAGKLNRVPVLGIQSGWDTISTRGLMPFLPDYMGVWGYQSRIFAQRMHGMPAGRVFHAGTPFADTTKALSDKSQSEIKQRLGLPQGKKVLFFAGNLWGYNEVRNLKVLEDAIKKGCLGDSCVLYRPHPFQHKSIGDLDFYAQDFQHVYLDPALAKQYKLAKESDKGFSTDKHSIPINFEHMKEIFAISSSVIAPLSTTMIQGAICGVPSVGIAYVDKVNKRYRRRFEFEELSILKSMPGIFLALTPDDLIDSCLKALRFSEDKAGIETMKQYAASAIYDDELGCTGRLQNAIGAILSAKDII